MNGRSNFWLLLAFALIFLAWYLSYKQPDKVTHHQIETLLVGTNIEFPPFSFLEKDHIVGFDIDIIKEVASRLKKNIDLKTMSFDALIPQLQTGALHIVAAGMTPTPERAKRVLFAKPHFTGDPLLLVSPAHRAVESVAALKDKRLVVNQGYTADAYASSLEGPKVIRLTSGQVTDGMLALQSDKADAFISSKSSLAPYFTKHGTKQFSIIPIEETEDKYALAISKQYPELLEEIQKALDVMEQDGTLKKIKVRWGLNG